MKTVALVIAKQNSKRLSNKNWRDFNGKPMFVWNLLKCLALFNKTYVSSDTSLILDIARKHGAIPIHRPAHLCGDTPSITVFQHAIEHMGSPGKPALYNEDIIISVQASAPNVEPSLIQKIKELMETGKFQEVMTCKRINEDNLEIHGSVWGLTKKRIENYKNPYEYTAELFLIDNSIDIHNYDDFLKAQHEPI